MIDGTRVCSVADVAPGTARRVEVDGTAVCLVHLDDAWYAIGDACSHGEFSLSDGLVWADECTVECPKHGSAFSLTSGEPQSLPALQPVAVWSVHLDGDDVVVTR
ncbi:MAG: non-heme iron oxygenase ferredoxin subunit [Actinomycetes bacterium]